MPSLRPSQAHAEPAPFNQTAQPPVAITLPDDARILVVKLASLGDLLLATHALRALRRRYPRARLDVLTTRQAAPLLRESPLVDHVYTLGDAGGANGQGGGASMRAALAPLGALARLRATRYDAVVLLHHLTLPLGRVKHRALLTAIGARWRAGLDNGHGGFLNVRVVDEGFGARHEAEYYLAVAAALGAAPSLAWPCGPAHVPPPHGGRGRVGGAASAGAAPSATASATAPTAPSATASAGVARTVGPPLIAVHPGAGGYSVARRWPVAKFAEVMRALHAEVGAQFVVVGGAEEAALQLRLLRALGYPAWAALMEDVEYAVALECPSAHTTGDDPQRLASILRRCDLFIGDDSFPMHMAAAVGTPVVAIFGPSNHLAWGPYTADAPASPDEAMERAVIVRRGDLVCSPCLYRGHALGLRDGCAPRPCLNELGSAVVVAAACRLLPHTPRARLPEARQPSALPSALQ